MPKTKKSKFEEWTEPEWIAIIGEILSQYLVIYPGGHESITYLMTKLREQNEAQLVTHPGLFDHH